MKGQWIPGAVIVRSGKRLRLFKPGDKEENLVGIAIRLSIPGFGEIRQRSCFRRIRARIFKFDRGGAVEDGVLRWGTVIVEIDRDEKPLPDSPVFVRPDGRLTVIASSDAVLWKRARFRHKPDSNGYVELHLT